MSGHASKHVDPQDMQPPVSRIQSEPRQRGGSVSEPPDKFPGFILVLCGLYGLLGAHLYATTLLEWVLIPALSGALIVVGAVMMKRDHAAGHEERSL